MGRLVGTGGGGRRVPDAASVRVLLGELDGPVNLTAHPVKGAPSGSFEELRAMGVQRITFGPLLQAALTEELGGLVRPSVTAG